MQQIAMGGIVQVIPHMPDFNTLIKRKYYL